jgi:hypothetical protein
MQFDQVFEAELGRVLVNLLLGSTFKFEPMAILHELRMKLSNQRQNSGHVLDAIVQGNETLPFGDNLVLGLGRIALLRLHILNQVGKLISVDLFPTGTLP